MRLCQAWPFIIITMAVVMFGAASAAADNVLSNVGFVGFSESDEVAPLPPGWVAFAGLPGEHISFEATGVGDARILLLHTGGQRNTGLRSEPLAATAGQAYEAAVEVYARNGNRVALYLDYWDANKQRIAHQSVYNTKHEQWETLNASITAPPDTAWVSIIMYAPVGTAPDEVRWRNPSLRLDRSYHVTVMPDRGDGLYELNEDITYVINLGQGGVPVDGHATWRVTEDGVTTLQSGHVAIEGGHGRVVYRPTTPGFFRLHATVATAEGMMTAQAAAGVAVDNIRAPLPAPDDFDAYWAEQLAQLAAVPAQATLHPVNSGQNGIDAFDLRVTALGAPVSGYFARPAEAQPGSLPAVIVLHGAGVRSASLDTAVGWAKEGALGMDVNAHGIDNGMPATYYDNLLQGELYDYRAQGRDDRDTFYFRTMFLRVVRAIDFIAAQPEWDGKTLVLYGTSQGGAQSLAGAGLDSRVSFVAAGVPAMANLSGIVRDRPMRWDLSALPHTEAQRVRETMRYFEGVHFAARSEADGFFTAGWLDETSKPTTIYAARNVLGGTTAVFNDRFVGHTNTREALQALRAAVLAHIKKNAS